MRLKSWVLSSSAWLSLRFLQARGQPVSRSRPGGSVARPGRSDGPQLSLPLRPRPSQRGRQFRLLVVMQQAEDVVAGETVTALEEVQLYGKGEAGDLSA